MELSFWTSAFNSSHFVNMKTEDRTETIDSEQTKEETGSLNHYLTFIKENLALLNEIVVDEFKMSRNALTAIKIGLFLQYIGITLLLYVILTSSLVLNGRIRCMDSAEREFNDTERLILASLCRNPNYQSRFGGVFLFLETFSMVLLLIKLVISIKKDNGKFCDYLGVKVDEKTLFWISFLPRSMLYLVLPLQSSMAANLSFQFSSLLSILRSPIVLVFSLTARIITLPMSVLFPYPLKNTAEADFSRFYKERSLSQEGLSTTKLSINCYESCRFSFDWSWCYSVLFFFLNFAIVYWFIGFTESLDDVGDGRAIDSRENYSDGVEFIRVSEVSEDFSFEEEEENKVKDGEKSVKDMGVKAKNVDEDLEAADGKEKASGDENSSKSPVLSQGSAKGPVLLSQEPSSTCEMTAESKGELKVIEGEGFIDPGLSGTGDLMGKSIDLESIDGQGVVKQHISSQDKHVVKFKDESDKAVGKERFRASSVGKQEGRECSKEISRASKGTQTFSLKLNKGCQTFVPIHLHKKINKKTQVSPIFVDAQTNTDAVVVNGVSNVPKEEDVPQREDGQFKRNIAVQENGGVPLRNNRNGEANESVKEELNVREKEHSENKSHDDLDKLENGRKSLESSPNSRLVTETNGSDHREKFGFPELKIIPRTLDFERRIVRENQIERINLDAFLKCLEKEDDRDVIFVEKDLLLDTFRNVVLLTKALATEDAVCPRSGDFADECSCCVHSLIKKCTKGELKSDEVDGLKMETEDDDYSDDESFFNGFRL